MTCSFTSALRRWPLLLALGCGSAPSVLPDHASTPRAALPATSTTTPVAPEDALAAVAFVHGGAGPWAVAGYRMGVAALSKLGLLRQSFDLDVTHHTPQKVQFSCMADGATAATGASVGKLNLKLVTVADADVATTYTNRATGKSVTLRPTAAFTARFRDIPRAQLADAGREVVGLPDSEIFEEAP
jgi:formylmethanofuran dehydrogenase subunit E